MFTSRHSTAALSALALTLSSLAGCGGAERDLKTCGADSDCGGSAQCVQGACVADRPPSLSFALPASTTTNRPLTVTASASDPDPGDTVSGVSWEVTTADGCEAAAEPGAAGQVELVFWCAGTYEVSAVATDGRGLASAPLRRTITVSQADGAPVVTAAAPIEVPHRCLGTPLRCRLDPGGGDPRITLSAGATVTGGGALTYEWKALPPAGADPAAVVTYSPGAGALDTSAWIETPGGAIAGEWRFRIRATGVDGLIGQAVLLVRVGNRLPELQVTPFLIDHHFLSGHYLASGTLVPQLIDPDGDPLVVSATWQESGAAGCTSQLGTGDPLAATLAIDCTDPRQLIGQATRGVLYRAVDVNGGAVEGLAPVEIANRAPVLRLVGQPGSASVRVDHAFGPCPDGVGSCYLASGSAAFELVDPDGDPVGSPVFESRLAPWMGGSMGEVAAAGGVATFRFASRAAVRSEFRQPDDSTGFSLAGLGADVLGATGGLIVEVRVGNRAPVMDLYRGTVQVAHRFDPSARAYLADATLSSFSDPDGDPLDAAGSAGDTTCPTVAMVGGEAHASCRLDYPSLSGQPPLASFVPSHALSTRVSDGWAALTVPATVSIQNVAPQAQPFDGTVESCYCKCRPNADGTGCLGTPTWERDLTNVPLRIDASEPDGDPVRVTVTPSTWVAAPVRTVLAGGASASLINPTLPASYTVTIDDGLALVTTTSRVTGVTCALQGQECTP